MEIEFSTNQCDDDDEDALPINDCTGVLSLERPVKVHSTVFTSKSLQAMDPEDQAMIALVISFCAVNFAQQHEDVKAYLDTYRAVHDDKVLTGYVVCVVVPHYKRYKLSVLNELKSLRMTRIVDVEVGPKETRSRPTALTQQPSPGQIQVTMQSMLNKFRLVDLTFSRIHFNTIQVTNDLPNDRSILKRPRRSFEDDGK